MKQPRTAQIVHLMSSLIAGILRNEPLLLKGSLTQLERLGGIYIKFLQVVVLNLDARQQENLQELLEVYEKSPADKLDLKSYLHSKGYNHLDKFSHIDEQPFATGSFGQLYHAQLLDGHEVVIKILRPSVMKYIHYDLRLLSTLSTLYGTIDKDRMINFRQVYREFRRTCLEEIDYLREVEIAERYYELYKNHAEMVIPKTYRELSTKSLIVQDFVDGISVATVLARQIHGEDARTIVRDELGSDLYQQLYRVGFVLLSSATTGQLMHADPHPGNIILLRDNKVALIDFGMVTQLKQNKGAFFTLLLQYQKYYGGDLAIENFAITALGFLSPQLFAALGQADKIMRPGWDAGQTALLEKVRQAAARATDGEVEQTAIKKLLDKKQIMRVLVFVVNKGNRFGFSFDMQSITLLKAAQTYMSLLGRFDQNSEVITRVVNDVIEYANAHLEMVIDDKPLTLTPHEAMEVLSSWFDKMSRRDPWLMNELISGYNR